MHRYFPAVFFLLRCGVPVFLLVFLWFLKQNITQSNTLAVISSLLDSPALVCSSGLLLGLEY